MAFICFPRRKDRNCGSAIHTSHFSLMSLQNVTAACHCSMSLQHVTAVYHCTLNIYCCTLHLFLSKTFSIFYSTALARLDKITSSKHFFGSTVGHFLGGLRGTFLWLRWSAHSERETADRESLLLLLGRSLCSNICLCKYSCCRRYTCSGTTPALR